MDDVRQALEEQLERHASVCGACDAGLMMACTCGDPRAALARFGDALRAVLDYVERLAATAAPRRPDRSMGQNSARVQERKVMAEFLHAIVLSALTDDLTEV